MQTVILFKISIATVVGVGSLRWPCLSLSLRGTALVAESGELDRHSCQCGSVCGDSRGHRPTRKTKHMQYGCSSGYVCQITRMVTVGLSLSAKIVLEPGVRHPPVKLKNHVALQPVFLSSGWLYLLFLSENYHDPSINCSNYWIEAGSFCVHSQSLLTHSTKTQIASHPRPWV